MQFCLQMSTFSVKLSQKTLLLQSETLMIRFFVCVCAVELNSTIQWQDINRHGDLSHVNDRAGIYCSVTIMLQALTMYSFLCLYIFFYLCLANVYDSYWYVARCIHGIEWHLIFQRKIEEQKKKKKIDEQ